MAPQILLITVRRVLLEEATIATSDYPDQEKNKNKFEKFTEKLLKDSTYNQKTSAEVLWNHLWQKIRFAGFKAERAAGEIDRIKKSGNMG